MENLEKIYKSNFKLYELLNSFAISGNKFKKASFFINIIMQVYSYTEDAAEAILKEKEVDRFFVKKINYICEIEDESETLCSTVLQENCSICNKKVENHEHFLLYKFDKKKELSDYNSSLLQKFFSPESIPVITELKSDFNSIIPFIGAGISKELGLPLWLEILYLAKEKLPVKHHDTFDTLYNIGNIDMIIEFIKTLAPLLNTDKKIKKSLILPQVKLKLAEGIAENSTAHYILKLNSSYIITTNYDSFLEQINNEFHLNYDESKTLNTFSGFDDLDKEKFIFHIHGDINDTDSMIVTKDDYKNMYDDKNRQKVLTGLMMRKSLLFMGFSLNDEYFSKEFFDICLANKDYATNYMICLENQTSTNLIKENINYIIINTKSIDKDSYDAKEQYRYLLNYINGQIFI